VGDTKGDYVGISVGVPAQAVHARRGTSLKHLKGGYRIRKLIPRPLAFTIA